MRWAKTLDIYAAAPALAAAHPVEATFLPLTSPASSKARAPQMMGFTKDGLVLRLTPGDKAAAIGGALDRRAGAQILRRFGAGADCGCAARAGARMRSDFADRRRGSGGITLAAGAWSSAFIGGLILNAMPCVLPILAMKALALAGHGGGEQREAAREGFAYAAGAVLSFLVFGLVIVAAAPGRRGGGLGLSVAGAHGGGGFRAADFRRGPQSVRRV